jgi:hypothetical protein
MEVLKGYREFFERNDDPNLMHSKAEEGMFFIFRSIEAWKDEKGSEEDIPAEELILEEFRKNRFLAHP